MQVADKTSKPMSLEHCQWTPVEADSALCCRRLLWQCDVIRENIFKKTGRRRHKQMGFKEKCGKETEGEWRKEMRGDGMIKGWCFIPNFSFCRHSWIKYRKMSCVDEQLCNSKGIKRWESRHPERFRCVFQRYTRSMVPLYSIQQIAYKRSFGSICNTNNW